MKFGFRKPSIKRSISARTTGQAKRAIKRALIPGYGKRGMGILHPKKALYNRVYRRTTFGLGDCIPNVDARKVLSMTMAHANVKAADL